MTRLYSLSSLLPALTIPLLLLRAQETSTTTNKQKLGDIRVTSVTDQANKSLDFTLTDPSHQITVRIVHPGELPGLTNQQTGHEIKQTMSADLHMTFVEFGKDTEPPCHRATGYHGCRARVVYVKEIIDKENHLIPAFVVTADGMDIAAEVVRQKEASFEINGHPIVYDPKGAALTGWIASREFRIDRYENGDGCRPYFQNARETFIVDNFVAPTRLGKENGIAVAPAKIFSTSALRQMLATTTAQLAGITGFNQALIAGAYSNLQGVTRDTSYLSAQVTTTPTPTVASTVTSGSTSSNTLTGNVTGNNSTVGTIATLLCPIGTLPSIGTGGIQACAPVATSLNGGASNQNTTVTTDGSTTSTNQVQGQTGNLQNSTTTTTSPHTGTVAPIPTSTALPAPSNIGLSALDMLAEQVQLNSQITTLRLLLQGAVSDQFLIRESRPIDTRAQTTVGFNITLNPPQRFKHAVAEVRVIVNSGPDIDDAPSVMNLLPAEKTYNVAKVTSRQDAFGAGVIVEPVNVGVSSGRSKDRLYLAKDTDTVALQFNPPGADRISRSTQEHIGDAFKEAFIWQTLGDQCSSEIPEHSVSFGWQFRPVLGADYVDAGPRQVFAQLALPTGLAQQFAPRVTVQTRWREYDPKRRVVGPVYKDSCSVSDDPNPISVLGGLHVDNVFVNDIGGGVVRVFAEGEFFAPGFSVMSGPNTFAPTLFDGRSIQFFAGARDLIANGDLLLVGENGITEPLGIQPRLGCGIDSAKLVAVPRPDGNSTVTATINFGKTYKNEGDKDGPPSPLILIAGQVYGLNETPFLTSGDTQPCKRGTDGTLTCTHRFSAPNDAIRKSPRFQIRDLAWAGFATTGTIEFDPFFNGISVLSTPKDDSSPVYYTITGGNLDKIKKLECEDAGCLEIYGGKVKLPLDEAHFEHRSATAAVLGVDKSDGTTKSLRLIWHGELSGPVEWSLAIPKEPAATTSASPSVLTVGDSREVTFSPLDIPGIGSLKFEDLDLKGRYDGDKKSLTVTVPTAVTKTPGRKELTLTDTAGKSKALPVDVRK